MNADGWQLQQMDLLPGTPEAPSLSGTQTPVTTQIAIGDFQSNYLPAPYLPLSWDVDGSWSYDPRTLTVLNVDRRRNNQAVAGLSYSVDSLLAQPDADELANATADSIDDTGLDDDVPSEIIDLAHQITDGAQGDGAKALALQNWLNDPARFTYDLNAPEGTGYEVLVNRPKTAAYRAPSAPMAAFAVESVIDELANKIGMDPLEVRINVASFNGGYASYAPQKAWSRRMLRDVICVSLAGRAAEALVFGPDATTTGAEADRKQATANAIAYVRHHGFGSRVSRTDVTVEKDDDLNTDVGPTNAEAEALMSAEADRATAAH